MRKGKAAIADGKGSFTLETYTLDEPVGDEVLVEIKASGVCHTDWDSLGWGKRIILGHEGAGVVTGGHQGSCGRCSRTQLGYALLYLLPVPGGQSAHLRSELSRNLRQ